MRALILSLLIVALAASVSLADPPATNPAPLPPPGIGVKVLILRFDPIAADNRQDWIGKAVQQTLLTEFARAAPFEPMTLPSEKEDARPVADAATAAALAKANGAKLAVLGSYQVNNGELRIVGQIIDSHSGQIVGMVKSSGTVRDLFGMEDALAAQARRQMPQLLNPPTTAPASTQPTGARSAHASAQYVVVPTGALRTDWHNELLPPNPAAQQAYARHAYLLPGGWCGYGYFGYGSCGYGGWGWGGWSGYGTGSHSCGWLGMPY